MLFIVLAAVIVGVRVGVWRYVRRRPDADGKPAKAPRWYWTTIVVGILAVGV